MAKTSKTFSIVNWILAAVFFISALIQLNDPDPAAWVAIYTSAGLACILVGSKGKGWMIAVLVGVAALAWAAVLAPDAMQDFRFGDLVKTMKAETPSIELGREVLGLVIIAAWMIVLVVVDRKASHNG